MSGLYCEGRVGNDGVGCQKRLAFQVTDYATGISGSNNSRRDVACNYAAGTNHGIVADGNTGKYTYAAAYPHIVPNSDGAGIFQALVAQFGVERMTCCVKATMRADKHMVAKGYGSCVEDDAVEVGKKMISHFNAVAVVAVKRRDDGAVVLYFSEQACKELLAFVGLVGMQVVECIAQSLAAAALVE